MYIFILTIIVKYGSTTILRGCNIPGLGFRQAGRYQAGSQWGEITSSSTYYVCECTATGCSVSTTLSAIDSQKPQSWMSMTNPVNRQSSYYLTRGSTYQPPSRNVIYGPPQTSGYSGYGSHSGPFGYSGHSAQTAAASFGSASASRGCDIPGIGMRPAGEYLEGNDPNCLTCTTYVCTCVRNSCNLSTRTPVDSAFGINRVPSFSGTNFYVSQLGK